MIRGIKTINAANQFNDFCPKKMAEILERTQEWSRGIIAEVDMQNDILKVYFDNPRSISQANLITSAVAFLSCNSLADDAEYFPHANMLRLWWGWD